MNLLAAEQDIVSKLDTDISGVKVKSFPQNEKEYKLLPKNGALLVGYSRSIYADPVNNRKKGVSQARTLEWIISIKHRNLQKHDGIYTLLEAVRNSLTGYTVNSISYSTVLRPISDGFVSVSGGVWTYEIVFHHDVETWEAFQ